MSDDDVNATFSANTSTPEVDGKKPYHIVLVSDLLADDRLDKLTPVDKNDFSAVMARAAAQPAVAIKNPLGGDDLECRLKLDSLKALQPVDLLEQVPGGRERLVIRKRLVERQSGKISSRDLETALGGAATVDKSLGWLIGASAADTAATPESPRAAGGASLLDMVEEPSESDKVTADVERLAAAAGDKDARVGGAEFGRVKSMIERIDAELTSIADAVYKHPDVQRAERAWRGLKFLVDRIDFREGPRLNIVHATREEAVARFIEQVVEPAFDGDIPTPGLVLFDYGFNSKPADVAMLDELAQHAASLPVPLVVPLTPEFFNVKSVALIKNLPNLSGLTDGWQFAKWKALRDQDYSKVIMPILGSFVLRAPHTGGKKGEFAYQQTVNSAKDLLWAGGHLAMGVCAAASYAKHGWPTRMFGAQAGKIEDLPVVQNAKDADKPFGPGDALLPDRKTTEFPAIGINLLQAVKGQDHCLVTGGVSMRRPVTTAEVSSQQAMMEVSTPYQMFSSLVASRLCEAVPTLHGLTCDQIKANLVFGLRGLMGLRDDDDEEAVQIATAPSPDNPGQTIVAVRITPPSAVVPGGLHVEMSFPVNH